MSVDAPAHRLAVAQRPDLLLGQPRLGASRRNYQLRREHHLPLADALLCQVSPHELDRGPVKLEPACLPVLGVVAHQERLAVRMVLAGYLDYRSGHFQDARLEIEVGGLQPDRLAEPDPLDTSSVEKT